MLSKLSAWVKKLLGKPETVIEQLPDKPVSEDVWDLMFMLADKLKTKRYGSIGVKHFDVVVFTYSNSVSELYRRLEMVIKCIDKDLSAPEVWQEREVTRMYDPLPDYFYDPGRGYWYPAEVNRILIEKAMIIHHLIDTKQINRSHPYYFYMRKEFYQVISDTVEVLSKLDGLEDYID